VKLCALSHLCSLLDGPSFIVKLLLQSSDLHVHCHPHVYVYMYVRPLLTARELRTHCGSGPGVRVRLATFLGAPLCCWLWELEPLDVSLEYNVELLHDGVEE
jgi:hypothetical protein